jgi:hypothetical protein
VTDTPTRYDVLDAAARADWPGITVPRTRVVLKGEDGWQDLVPRMTPRERVRVLQQLGRHALLVCTPGGRARLRRWLDRQWAREWEPAPPLSLFGDESMVGAVEAGLARLPAPVRHLVLTECYVLTVGVKLHGWTSNPLPADRYPIQVWGTEFEPIARITVHEAGHRWHAPPSVAGVTALTVSEHAAFLDYARAEGWPVDVAEARKAEDERLAVLCELAWRG